MRIGAAAHCLWTASFANKEDAFFLTVMRYGIDGVGLYGDGFSSGKETRFEG